jgi:hypothetical protein
MAVWTDEWRRCRGPDPHRSQLENSVGPKEFKGANCAPDNESSVMAMGVSWDTRRNTMTAKRENPMGPR